MWWGEHLGSEADLWKCVVVGERIGTAVPITTGVCSAVSSMRDHIDLLAMVTVLGVLEQGKCPLYNASIRLIMLNFVGCGSCILCGVSGVKVTVFQPGKMVQIFGCSWQKCHA